jgi:gliding motility-associated-like protein
LWLLGDSAKSSLEEPGEANFTTPGNYDIILYAYNSLGCVDTAKRAITVYQEEVLYAPNAFTPNGDGNNDYFEIFGKKDGWKQIQILIFDRWGEKVFESNDMNFKWDGVYKGELMQPGVYVYLLRIVYTNNHTDKLHKGSLTLIR